ncbi:ING family protein [Abortiporus biennis]
MSTTNLEEAATVAAEFVSSLENLPAEVQFLLAELKHKDIRVQELQQEINKEGAKYIRHSNRSAGQPLSSKDLSIPTLIRQNTTEILKLSNEKEQLAERIVSIIARARLRLDNDLQKVLRLQGDLSDEGIGGGSSSGGILHQQGPVYIGASRNPVLPINESLRSALGGGVGAGMGVGSGLGGSSEALASIPSASTPSAAAPPHKKRKITSTASAGSIKLPSPVPSSTTTSASISGAVTARSRLSQQVTARNSPTPRHGQRRGGGGGIEPTSSAAANVVEDEDAVGEEDVDENGEDGGEDGADVDDTELYCFCRKLSYGEMIGCDNPACRYQWFHLTCVNLKPPLPDRWEEMEIVLWLCSRTSIVT